MGFKFYFKAKMKHLLFLFTTIALISFVSCSKKQEQKTAPADSLKVDSVNSVQSETQAAMNGPEWFKNPPKAEDVLYAVGQASSQSPTIAREKAIMNARVAMAEFLKKEKSGLSPDSLNVDLRFSRVAKETSVKKGKRWYHYVLMEMPKH